MVLYILLLAPAIAATPILKILLSNQYEHFDKICEELSNLYIRKGTINIIYPKKMSNNIPNQVSRILGSRNPTVVTNEDYVNPDSFYLMFRMKMGKSSNIIILLEDARYTDDVLLVVREQALWNAQAKIIIMIICENNCQQISTEILQAAWKTTMSLNVAVMTIGESVNFFTSFPYSDCGVFASLKVELEDLFPMKIVRDFGGCEFITATVVKEPYILPPETPLDYQEGVSIKMLQELAAKKNFQLKYIESPDGENPYEIYGPNNQRVGLLGLLYHHKADIACFGTGLGDDRYYVAECLNSHTVDTVAWMVPAPGPRSNWDSVYIGFSKEIWILVFTLLLGIAVTFRLVAARTRDQHYFPTFSKCLLESWSATLNFGITTTPKSHSMKAFAAIVFIYAIIITSAYQSFLITLLTSVRRAKGFETIEEVVDHGLIAHLFPAAQYLFNHTQHDLWEKILSTNIYVESYNYTEIFLRMVKKRDAYSMMIHNAAEYIIRKSFLSHSGPLIKSLNQYFQPYPVTCYLTPGHPLKQLVNDHISHLVEAGIFDIWLTRVLRGAENLAQLEHSGSDSRQKALSYENLEVTFLILGIGLVASITAFLLELYWKIPKKETLRKTEE